MYNSPLVVGVRQATSWHQWPSVKQTLLMLGENTGNMMFTEALSCVIKRSKLGSFSLSDAEMEGRDVIVLAAANWINSFEDFGWLADRLESIKLPVVLVGVGAQSSLNMELPALRPGTLRLLELVKDRSSSIAARGTFTCEVLSNYGIKTGIATGCPSLLLAKASGPSVASHCVRSSELCCVHSTRHGFDLTDRFHSYLYRQAYKQKLDIILQSEVADMYVALRRPEAEYDYARAMSVLRSVYGSDDIDTLQTYLAEHSHAFTNFESWINYMKTREFSVGTRIHGTVASIIAGTPATLIVHDSRTLEMAESMSIPFVMSSEINSTKDLDLLSLIRHESFNTMTKTFSRYRANYIEFFKRSKLPFNSNGGY